MVRTELIKKQVTMKGLLKFYDINKVENYCKKCENYMKIWSCPSHDFDPYEYLNKYTTVDLYALKLYLPQNINKDEVLELFQKERRIFSDMLMSLEDKSEALIAGNCYQCEVCERVHNKPCILKEKMRYSLESLGLKVSEITSDLMDIELIWSKDDIPEYLVTVGALMK